MELSQSITFRFVFGLALLSSFLSAPAFSVPLIQICPRFLIFSKQIHFSDTEIRLICGDPKNPAWNHIPDNQAIFLAKSFLQSRGYFQPKFDKKEDVVLIDPGPETHVTKLTVTGGPSELDPEKLREITGEVLTSALLNDAKQRIGQRLKAMGYPCPVVSMEANYETGEVFARLQLGPIQNLIRVEEQPIEGLDEGIFRRYDAFELGERYNDDLLHLTTDRILSASLVQSTFFEAECKSYGTSIRQRFVAGPSRLVSLGVGVDTERLLIGRASWRNSRMGSKASSLEITAEASFKDQTFTVDSSWYVLDSPSRFFLRPFFTIKHENFQTYEQITSKLQLSPATTYDNSDFGMRFNAGPALNLNRTIRGVGPSFSKFLSLRAELSATEHYYELYRNSPRSGWEIRFEGNFTHNTLFSDVTAQMLKLSIDKLWNLSHYDPPLFVLGFRSHLGTTITSENVHTSVKLPTDFRFFLGGSSDIRGFSLRELPYNGGRGALTSLDAELELRANLLPWGLQPIVFTDAGMLGSKSVQLDNRLYWAPGFGARWQLPFGVVRGTLAHGFISGKRVTNDSSHTQLYLSFGEEF